MILFYVCLVSDLHWRKCQVLYGTCVSIEYGTVQVPYRYRIKITWGLNIFVIGLSSTYLLCYLHDESIPPCRRISDTSRHHCGWTLLLCIVPYIIASTVAFYFYNRSSNPCSFFLSVGATKRNTGKSSDIGPTKKTEVLTALDTPGTGCQPRCVSDQWFGAGFVYSGSGSRFFWPIQIRTRIQSFDGQKCKKLIAETNFKIFLFRIAIYLSLGLHKGRPIYRRSL